MGNETLEFLAFSKSQTPLVVLVEQPVKPCLALDIESLQLDCYGGFSVGTEHSLILNRAHRPNYTEGRLRLSNNPKIGGNMSLTVSIEIPQEVLHAARMTPEEMKRELAVLLFQQGKLSFGKAREMAGMTVWAFQQLLGSRGITVHYDVPDYEEDLATLKALGRL